MKIEADVGCSPLVDPHGAAVLVNAPQLIGAVHLDQRGGAIGCCCHGELNMYLTVVIFLRVQQKW